MIDLLTLASGDARLTVDVAAGGRIASLAIGDAELIVDQTTDPDPLNWGCYPMIPFAGRLRDGLLDFDGQHQLPRTMGPHAIHGYGFTSGWRQIDDSTIEWAFTEPWPYTGRARQHFDLQPSQLTIELHVDAHDRQPMQVGWHPWFRRSNTAGTLEFELPPCSMYERGDDGIPTGRLVDVPPGPWDDCFTGLAHEPELRWGELAVRLSSTADHWVVYDQPEHAVCVEPQTGPPNVLNTDPTIVDAGDTLSTSFTIAWE